MLRSAFLALVAAFALTFAAAAPAAAQKDGAQTASAAGQWNGWVQWGGEDPLNNITWTLNGDGTLATDTQNPEYGYWVQVGDYVELLYPCTSGRFICHYRGRLSGSAISGSAETNEGHTATFEMRRR